MNQDKLNKVTVGGGLVVLGVYMFMRGFYKAALKEPVMPTTKDDLVNEALNVAMTSVGGALFMFAIHLPSLPTRGRC